MMPKRKCVIHLVKVLLAVVATLCSWPAVSGSLKGPAEKLLEERLQNESSNTTAGSTPSTLTPDQPNAVYDGNAQVLSRNNSWNLPILERWSNIYKTCLEVDSNAWRSSAFIDCIIRKLSETVIFPKTLEFIKQMQGNLSKFQNNVELWEKLAQDGNLARSRNQDMNENLVPQSSLPPMPYEDFGACPFECCTYRRWIATKDTAIQQDRNENSPILFNVNKEEWATALTGVVNTTVPGKAKVLRTTMINDITVKSGEIAYLMTYQGEGVYETWYKGEKWEPYPDMSALEIMERPESTWWVQIKNNKGQIGWSKEPDNFDNRDACGGNVEEFAGSPIPDTPVASVSLNIKELPQIKEKQDFTRFFGSNPQIELEFLSVATSERERLVVSSDPMRDVCYLGAVDALSAQQASRLVRMGLNDLAASVFSASLKSFTTGSFIGDYLLKLTAEMIQSVAGDVPLDQTLLIFVTENTAGYMVAQATKSFIEGKVVSELTKKTITYLLEKDDLTIWNLSGDNKITTYQKSGETPLTNLKAKISYNPYTHYITALISAGCKLQTGTKKTLYRQRYEVEKTTSGSARMIDGTLSVTLLYQSQ